MCTEYVIKKFNLIQNIFNSTTTKKTYLTRKNNFFSSFPSSSKERIVSVNIQSRFYLRFNYAASA